MSHPIFVKPTQKLGKIKIRTASTTTVPKNLTWQASFWMTAGNFQFHCWMKEYGTNQITRGDRGEIFHPGKIFGLLLTAAISICSIPPKRRVCTPVFPLDPDVYIENEYREMVPFKMPKIRVRRMFLIFLPSLSLTRYFEWTIESTDFPESDHSKIRRCV